MNAKWASSKTKLAQCLGLSRQTLYVFARLPDSPPPRANGMHSVPEWRRFITARREKLKAGLTQKEDLQILLLQARLERERFELSERDHTIREQITEEVCSAAFRVVEVLRVQVQSMPDQLSGRFSGLAPMAIYKLFKSELHERFRRADDALQKIKHESRRKVTRKKTERESKSNVVQFKAAVN